MVNARVCVILEGSYPYVNGGVSAWMNDYLKYDKDSSYALWTIYPEPEDKGVFRYELPKNVVSIDEICLKDAYVIELRKHNKNRREKLKKAALGLKKIIIDDDEEGWEALFEVMTEKQICEEFFSSEAFLDLAELVSEKVENLGLSNSFYGLRSMLLPICHCLIQQVPSAEIYHSVSAGYSGILGAMAAFRTKKPFILTEHGIYPRERAEELILSEWIVPELRGTWIRLFYNMSKCAYKYASVVTSLYEGAMEKQTNIGCDSEKCVIIPNGIHIEKFSAVRAAKNKGYVNIGAFVRFSPIKDIKTLIYAFCELQNSFPEARLHIMGGIDDREYYNECVGLISRLGVKNLFIDGFVNTAEAMADMDFTVLSSISEEQPLTILESFASSRACIATKVGNCEELLSGTGDSFGTAGICVRPMKVHDMAEAMLKLCVSEELRLEYGRNGCNRVIKFHSHEEMMNKYLDIYRKAE